MAILIDTINCGSGSAGTWFDGCKTTPRDFTKAFLVLNLGFCSFTFDPHVTDKCHFLMFINGRVVTYHLCMRLQNF